MRISRQLDPAVLARLSPRKDLVRNIIDRLIKFENKPSGEVLKDEQIWTLLFTYGFAESNCLHTLAEILTEDPDIPAPKNTWLEMLPLPPRKGGNGSSESNSQIDLTLGDIALRSVTTGGVEPECGSGYVCMVEAKWFSDIWCRTTNDPHRNQLARVIETALTFQNLDSDCKASFPEAVHVTILTPGAFKYRLGDVGSRFYYYKFHEYVNDTAKLHLDICSAAVPTRNCRGWQYPNLVHRLQNLHLHWVTFEDLFRAMPSTSYKVALGGFLRAHAGSIFDQPLLGKAASAIVAPPPPQIFGACKGSERCHVEDLFPMCQADGRSAGSYSAPTIPDWLQLRSAKRGIRFPTPVLPKPVECTVYDVATRDIALITALSLSESYMPGEFVAMLDLWVAAAEKHLGGLGEWGPEFCGCRLAGLRDLRDTLESDTAADGSWIPLSQFAGWLQEWDGTAESLLDCGASASREMEPIRVVGREPHIPIRTFVRSAFLLPMSREIEGRPFSPGCYLDDSLRERPERREHVLLHEMAHIAMAAHRESGAIRCCRWMEESLAEYLAGLDENNNFANCKPSWCEADVYAVYPYWTMKTPKQVEDALAKYLRPPGERRFCRRVNDMREMAGTLRKARRVRP